MVVAADNVAPVQVDVVIIGGGLAGLSAGLCLADYNTSHNEGASFVVLEREARLGGRTETATEDLDLGGAYVGAAQNYIQYLLRRFGIKTIDEYLPPDKQWLFEYAGGRVEALPGDNPLALPGGDNCAIRLLELDTMTLEVRNHLDNPNQSRYARLDTTSVEDYLQDQLQRHRQSNADPRIGMSEETVQAFVCSVRSAFSVEPSELSFFYLLYYAACAGCYSALVDVMGGSGAAEGARLPRGTQEVVAKLREEIQANGARGSIQQSVRITQIHQEADSVTVVASDGRSWRAQRVIMAMSPATVAAMSHASSVAGMTDAIGRRQQLEQAMARCQGRTIKGFVKFKGPFWRARRVGPRDQGLMGFLLSAGNQGNPPNHQSFPLDWTLDNVWEDPRTLEQRASIMTFIVGDAATYWYGQPPAQRATAVIEHLRRVYGFTDDDLLDSANVLGNYVERNWPAAQPNQLLPSPAAMFPPDGSFTHTFPALRQAIGRVHYAGSESALEWNGYMNGAVQSGFRAGSEVLTALALT